MFFTVTLSPAIDATVTVAGTLNVGGVHRVTAETRTPGGKGINVAKALAANGVGVTAGGIVGRSAAALFETFLEAAGITARFLVVPDATRTNVMAVDGCGRELKLNRPAFPELAYDGAALAAYIGAAATAARVVILSGSLPARWPADTYAQLVQQLRGLGLAVVLDAGGEALRLGACAGPDVIKPNRDELADITGCAPADGRGIADVAAALADRHRVVIVSDGAAGAYFADAATVLFAAAPRVRPLDTTGAGDTLLGQFCADYFAGADAGHLTAATAARAVAAGAAAVEAAGTPVPDLARIEALAAEVRICDARAPS